MNRLITSGCALALLCIVGCASNRSPEETQETNDVSNERIPSPATTPDARADALVDDVELDDPNAVADAFANVSASLFPLCPCIDDAIESAFPDTPVCDGNPVRARRLEQEADSCRRESRAYEAYLGGTLHALFGLNECLKTVSVRLSLGCAALPRDVLARCTATFEDEADDAERLKRRLSCL